LDREGARYALKCPAQSPGFRRVDNFVAYLQQADWRDLSPKIVDALAEVPLKDTSPPLTFPLARGVAMAEDPGNGLSFGETICRALAPAVQAMSQTAKPDADPAPLTLALSKAGLDPTAPWRRPSR
jgi:hypothetical protein